MMTASIELDNLVAEFRKAIGNLRARNGRDLFKTHELGLLLDAMDMGAVRTGCRVCVGSGLCRCIA